MTKTKPLLIIFDIDGTLLDTTDYIYQAFEHSLRTNQAKIHNRKILAKQVGKRLDDSYGILAPGQDIEPFISEHRYFQTKNIHLVKAYPSVAHALELLSKTSVKLAVFTSRMSYVNESLEAGGINPGLFTYIVDGTMVKHGKPNPEGVSLILEKLHMPAEDSVFVGDAAVDIQTGNNAGVGTTVAVSYGFGTKKDMDKVGPDYTIEALDQLPAILGFGVK